MNAGELCRNPSRVGEYHRSTSTPDLWRPSAGAREHLTPGVVLIKPNANSRAGWRARYTDASGKVRKVTLERIDAKTADTRRVWAVRLSEQLQRVRSDAKAGVLRTYENVPLTEAVKRYVAAHPRLAVRTSVAYRDAVDTLARGREKMSTAQLTPAVLAAWRDERALAPTGSAKGKRGEQRTLSRLRSPHSVNRELRAVATNIEYGDAPASPVSRATTLPTRSSASERRLSAGTSCDRSRSARCLLPARSTTRTRSC
jgi:hypothetical protein